MEDTFKQHRSIDHISEYKRRLRKTETRKGKVVFQRQNIATPQTLSLISNINYLYIWEQENPLEQHCSYNPSPPPITLPIKKKIQEKKKKKSKQMHTVELV